MSLQLWTELLNLSDTDVLPQVSFGQEQLLVHACCGKRFTGVTKGISDFWGSTHSPGMVLVVPAWLAPAFITPRRISAQQRGSPGQRVCSPPKPELCRGPLWCWALSRREDPSEPIACDQRQGVTVQAGHGQFEAAQPSFLTGLVTSTVQVTQNPCAAVDPGRMGACISFNTLKRHFTNSVLSSSDVSFKN